MASVSVLPCLTQAIRFCRLQTPVLSEVLKKAEDIASLRQALLLEELPNCLTPSLQPTLDHHSLNGYVDVRWKTIMEQAGILYSERLIKLIPGHLLKFAYEQIWLPRCTATKNFIYRRHKINATSSARIQPSNLTPLPSPSAANFGTVEPGGAWAYYATLPKGGVPPRLTSSSGILCLRNVKIGNKSSTYLSNKVIKLPVAVLPAHSLNGEDWQLRGHCCHWAHLGINKRLPGFGPWCVSVLLLH